MINFVVVETARWTRRQVTMNGPTATDWNGASYTLEVGTTIPGQTQPTGKIIARGTINEVGCLIYDLPHAHIPAYKHTYPGCGRSPPNLLRRFDLIWEYLYVCCMCVCTICTHKKGVCTNGSQPPGTGSRDHDTYDVIQCERRVPHVLLR